MWNSSLLFLSFLIACPVLAVPCDEVTIEVSDKKLFPSPSQKDANICYALVGKLLVQHHICVQKGSACNFEEDEISTLDAMIKAYDSPKYMGDDHYLLTALARPRNKTILKEKCKPFDLQREELVKMVHYQVQEAKRKNLLTYSQCMERARDTLGKIFSDKSVGELHKLASSLWKQDYSSVLKDFFGTEMCNKTVDIPPFQVCRKMLSKSNDMLTVLKTLNKSRPVSLAVCQGNCQPHQIAVAGYRKVQRGTKCVEELKIVDTASYFAKSEEPSWQDATRVLAATKIYAEGKYIKNNEDPPVHNLVYIVPKDQECLN